MVQLINVLPVRVCSTSTVLDFGMSYHQYWRLPSAKSPNVCCNGPGGGLDKPIDRDQQSWVFLNNPKKYFATNRKLQKILSKKQNPKNTLKYTIQFTKVKHDMIIMETHDH